MVTLIYYGFMGLTCSYMSVRIDLTIATHLFKKYGGMGVCGWKWCCVKMDDCAYVVGGIFKINSLNYVITIRNKTSDIALLKFRTFCDLSGFVHTG